MLTTITKLHRLKFMVLIIALVGLFCTGCGEGTQAKNPDKSSISIDVSQDDDFDEDFDFMAEEFEESHPAISAAVGRVATALSNLGI